MTTPFTYDFVKDYQKANKSLTIINIVGGLGLLTFGIVQTLAYFDSGNTAGMLVSTLAILGGLSFLLMLLNGNKPFVKEGQVYLRVDEQKIYTKLNKFAPEQTIALSKIAKINMAPNAVLIRTQTGKEVWIDTHKIQNKDKQAKFLQMMQAWQLPSV